MYFLIFRVTRIGLLSLDILANVLENAIVIAKFCKILYALEKNNGRIKITKVESCSSATKNVCDTKLSMATKLGKEVTYVKGFSAIKSYGPFITLS